MSLESSNASCVYRFLSAEGMLWRDLNILDLMSSYNEEIKIALQPGGANEPQTSSLQMLPTYLDSRLPLPNSGDSVVIDAGGSHLRTTLVSFVNGQSPQLSNTCQSPMPGSYGYINRINFFNRIADQVGQLIRSDLPLGFCFSYSIESLPNLDGRLNHWSKEINAPELPGCLMGQGLREALDRRGFCQPKKLILLNDASATLLTGMAFWPNRCYSDAIGYILGTGINLAYSEPADKLKFVAAKGSHLCMVLNTETGNFSLVPQGSADKILDQNSANPGRYRLEKMCSGRYFGELVRRTLLLATEKNVLPRCLNQQLTNGSLSSIFSLSSEMANSYLQNPWRSSPLSDCLSNTDERQKVYYLIDALMQRAAMVCAVVVAAATLRTDTGFSPLNPLALVIDGSSYYNYHQFANRFHIFLEKILAQSNEQKRFIECISMDNAPIIGAAVAALTQKEWI